MQPVSASAGERQSVEEKGVLVTNNETLYERSVAISQHPLRAHREIISDLDFSFPDELNWNYRIHPLATVWRWQI